jgi:hypothetical protein
LPIGGRVNGGAQVPNPAAARRLVRVLKAAFVGSPFFFFYIVVKTSATAAHAPSATVEMALTLVALTNVALGYAVPRLMMRAAQRTPGSRDQATVIQRWLTANVLGFALLESCSLLGMALHFLGAELQRTELLIAVGIIATVFFSPGALPDGGSGPTEPR